MQYNKVEACIFVGMKYVTFILCFVFLYSCTSKKHIVAKKNETIAISTLNNEIKNWLGAPYLYGGNTKLGVDCSGFVQQIYLKVYNKKIPRTVIEIYKIAKKINAKNLLQGDLIFFKLNKKEVSHVGIYLGEQQFVHASTKNGVTSNSLSEKYYSNSFVCGGKVE